MSLPPGFVLDGSPPPGFVVDPAHNTPMPEDSDFLQSVKNLGNEAVRVGAKAVTGIPLMGGDFVAGLGNLASKVAGGDSHKFAYPSDVYSQALDKGFAPPTTGAGKASEALSVLLASLGKPELTGVPSIPAVPKGAQTGAAVIKNQTLADSQAADYVVPPSMTGSPNLAARTAEGIGGKQQTALSARFQNQPVTDALANQALGVGANTPLDLDGVRAIRNEAIDKGYGPLKAVGTVPLDQAHLDFVNELAGADRGAANISPAFGNPEIAAIAKALTPKSAGTDPTTLNPKAAAWDSKDMVDAVSVLRGKASDAFEASNSALGNAYKKAANSLESLLDRHLSKQDDADSQDLLSNFRLYRTRIAQTHNVEEALNGATGNVDAVNLGKQLSRGEPLSGPLLTAAKFGQAFKGAATVPVGQPPELSPLDLWGSVAAAPGTYGASLLGPLARVGLRTNALSPSVQRSLVQPTITQALQPKGKTLSKAALDAVFANPTAFTNMYEDAKNQ